MNRIIREGDITVIELGGSYDSLDADALAELEALVVEQASNCHPPQLLLDLGRTMYIGSSFIELLVRAWRQLKDRGGTLALCGVQPFCAEVLRITRLDSLWDIYPGRAEAIATIAQKKPGPLA